MIPLTSLATRHATRRARRARPLQQPAGGQDHRPGARRASARARRSRAVEQIAREVLPRGLQLRLGRHVVPGEAHRAARRRSRSGSRSIMVFLILAAQYERWSLPLVGAARGAVRHVRRARRGAGCAASTNDVYFQIGLVDADRPRGEERDPDRRVRGAEARTKGMSPSAAALEAARLRFRPILMTSLAFILGVLPLAISTRRGRGRAALDRAPA